MPLPRPKLKGAPGRSLWREISLTLLLKMVLIYALWYMFFSQPVVKSMIDGMDPQHVANALLANPSISGNSGIANPSDIDSDAAGHLDFSISSGGSAGFNSQMEEQDS